MPLPEIISQALAPYPQTIVLADATELVLKVAKPANTSAILRFARGLSEQDLLFLRVDITQQSAVENWLANVSRGETVTLLAWQRRAVVGYATVDWNPARWTRRVGEIRVHVAPALRGQGLGRHLTGKIFDVARRIGLKKLTANITTDQPGAQAAFGRLGFRPEAVLTDHIEDRRGEIHDLTIMSYDIDGFSGQMDTPLRL